jgi:hypothetical protein
MVCVVSSRVPVSSILLPFYQYHRLVDALPQPLPSHAVRLLSRDSEPHLLPAVYACAMLGLVVVVEVCDSAQMVA